MRYTYTDSRGHNLDVETEIDAVACVMVKGEDFRPTCVDLPMLERIKLAEAVAGDDYAVVPSFDVYPRHAGSNTLLGRDTLLWPDGNVIVHNGEYFYKSGEPLAEWEQELLRPRRFVDLQDCNVGDRVRVTETGYVIEAAYGKKGVHTDDGASRWFSPSVVTELIAPAVPEPDPEEVEAIREAYNEVLRLHLSDAEVKRLMELGITRVVADNA